MKEKFNILHIASSNRWTGVADPATSLAHYQQHNGNRVWFACASGRDFADRARERDLNVVTSFHLYYKFNPLYTLSDLRSLRAFIAEHEIDVVHCHLPHDHALAAFAFKKIDRPCILVRTFHRYERPDTDRFHTWLYVKKTDLLITLFQNHKKAFVNDLKIEEDRVSVIYGGVDTERFSPEVNGDGIRRSLGIPHDAPLAGIVSRLRRDRGFNWLLHAVPRVLDEIEDARFIIVGRGELEDSIRTRINEPIFKGRVLMAGYRMDDLPNCYAAMDVFVLLGIGADGSCRAALEAMATGTPVVGVKLGALCDTIEDHAHGFLVTRNDVNGLASTLARVLREREATRCMGIRARERILESFTEEKRAQESLYAYRRAWERTFSS